MTLSGLCLAHFKLLLAMSQPNQINYASQKQNYLVSLCLLFSTWNALLHILCHQNTTQLKSGSGLTSLTHDSPPLPSHPLHIVPAPLEQERCCTALVCRSALKLTSATGDRNLAFASLFPQPEHST